MNSPRSHRPSKLRTKNKNTKNHPNSTDEEFKGNPESDKMVHSTPVPSEQSNVETVSDDDSPTFFMPFTQDGVHDDLEVVWDWNSPKRDSRPALSKKLDAHKKRMKELSSPLGNIPAKRKPFHRVFSSENSLRRKLEELNKKLDLKNSEMNSVSTNETLDGFVENDSWNEPKVNDYVDSVKNLNNNITKTTSNNVNTFKNTTEASISPKTNIPLSNESNEADDSYDVIMEAIDYDEFEMLTQVALESNYEPVIDLNKKTLFENKITTAPATSVGKKNLTDIKETSSGDDDIYLVSTLVCNSLSDSNITETNKNFTQKNNSCETPSQKKCTLEEIERKRLEAKAKLEKKKREQSQLSPINYEIDKSIQRRSKSFDMNNTFRQLNYLSNNEIKKKCVEEKEKLNLLSAQEQIVRKRFETNANLDLSSNNKSDMKHQNAIIKLVQRTKSNQLNSSPVDIPNRNFQQRARSFDLDASLSKSNSPPLRCTQQEIEKKRLEAVAKLKQKEIIEKKRLEALAKLQRKKQTSSSTIVKQTSSSTIAVSVVPPAVTSVASSNVFRPKKSVQSKMIDETCEACGTFDNQVSKKIKLDERITNNVERSTNDSIDVCCITDEQLIKQETKDAQLNKQETKDACQAEDQSVLECAVCLQQAVQPAILPCNHTFCFLCIKGTAFRSKLCPLCRRDIPDNFLERPILLEQNKTEEVPENEYQWFYKGRNGWWKYDHRTNIEIEEMFQASVPSFDILICGQLYTIDFQTSVQYPKHDCGRRRVIKRDIVTSTAKGIAGIVVPEDST